MCVFHYYSTYIGVLDFDQPNPGARTFRPRTFRPMTFRPGLEVIKLEYSLRLKIKHNDWLLADTYPQVAYQCALF